ncbi:hypothetical protein ACFZAG_41305 [Streptomyces sp. NPDC012403]|uniref:hypothetical protein n=1 Tax=Streptomyces sp. NPDC012403 TaxID=3364831 RepID=UPI0036EDA58A
MNISPSDSAPPSTTPACTDRNGTVKTSRSLKTSFPTLFTTPCVAPSNTSPNNPANAPNNASCPTFDQSTPAGRAPTGADAIVSNRAANDCNASSNASNGAPTNGTTECDNACTANRTRSAARARTAATAPSDTPPVKNDNARYNLICASSTATSSQISIFDSRTCTEIKTRRSATPSNPSANSRSRFSPPSSTSTRNADAYASPTPPGSPAPTRAIPDCTAPDKPRTPRAKPSNGSRDANAPSASAVGNSSPVKARTRTRTNWSNSDTPHSWNHRRPGRKREEKAAGFTGGLRSRIQSISGLVTDSVTPLGFMNPFGGIVHGCWTSSAC